MLIVGGKINTSARNNRDNIDGEHADDDDDHDAKDDDDGGQGADTGMIASGGFHVCLSRQLSN